MTYKERYPAKDIPPEAVRIAKYIGDGACNAAGIIAELGRVRELLLEQFHQHGTDWLNKHPCIVVIVGRLYHLSRLDRNGDGDRYFIAMDVLDEASKEEN